MNKVVFSIRSTYFIIIILLFSINSNLIFGQVTETFLCVPQKFIIPTEDVDYEDNNKYLNGSLWVVYSDRQYNKSYTTPKRGEVKNILEFLSPFFVAERNGNYLNLFKQMFDEHDSTYKFIDYGWVHMDNLLLWNHSFISTGNINIKAIVVHSKKTENLIADSLLGQELGFDIFYVYKEFNNSILLGKQPKFMDGENGVKKCIITWVQKENVWVWDNITTLEPIFCHTQQGVQECIPDILNVYSDRKNARKYEEKLMNQKNLIYTLNRNESKWPGTPMRFPLSEIKDNIAKVFLLNHLHIKHTDESASTTTGFTPIAIKKSKTTLFKKSLLYTSEDLARTTSILSELSASIKSSSSRPQLYEAWLKILKHEYFEKTEGELKALTIEDIHRTIFHKRITGLGSEITLEQLLIPDLVTEQIIQTYYDKIDSSHKVFLGMINGNVDTSHFTSNGIMYYWIDSELLP